MIKIFALLLINFSTVAAAEGCFPFCDPSPWKNAACGALCTEQFWNNATAEDVHEILALGHSVNVKVEQGWEPIHFAANFGTAEGVIALLDAGADPDGHSVQQGIETPLYGVINSFRSQFRNAISADDIHSENRFIALSEPNRNNWLFSRRRPPLFDDAELARVKPIISALTAAGADVDIRVENGLTPLLFSLERGQVEIAKLLAEAGADVNVVDDAGVSALGYAVERYDGAPSAKILTDAGAELDQIDADGNTALLNAIQTWKFDIAEVLITAGADVNVSNADDISPMSWILDNIWRFDNNFETALESRPHFVEITERLLEAGAETHLPDLPVNPPVNEASTDEAFPLTKALFDRFEITPSRPGLERKLCTIRTRRGAEVTEEQRPCPN